MICESGLAATPPPVLSHPTSVGLLGVGLCRILSPKEQCGRFLGFEKAAKRCQNHKKHQKKHENVPQKNQGHGKQTQKYLQSKQFERPAAGRSRSRGASPPATVRTVRTRVQVGAKPPRSVAKIRGPGLGIKMRRNPNRFQIQYKKTTKI